MSQTEALMEIARRNGNMLTPGAVIAAARNPKSPLHGAFTWNNTEAANKWRIHEAQKLIRDCRIKIESGDKTVKTYAFIGLSVDRESGSEDNPYRLAADVARDADLLSVAEHDAVEQLRSLEGRYRHLKKLAGVWSAVDAL